MGVAESLKNRLELFQKSLLKTAGGNIRQDAKENEKKGGNGKRNDRPHEILSTKHVDVNLQKPPKKPKAKERSNVILTTKHVDVLTKEKKKRNFSKNGGNAVLTTKHLDINVHPTKKSKEGSNVILKT